MLPLSAIHDIHCRVAAELLDRIDRTRDYLDELGPGNTGELQLVRTIVGALEKIETALLDSFESSDVAFRARSRVRARQAVQFLFAELSKFARWFTTIHELLVYLPRRAALPESFSTLERPFGLHFASQRPAIILGSVFNALEFDFFEVLDARLPDLRKILTPSSPNVVLQLPISDRVSPAAWAILAHELGHAIPPPRGLFASLAARYADPKSDFYLTLEAWCHELWADIVAADALGPAPILALLSVEYCVYALRDYPDWTASHPTTRWRLLVVSDYLRHKYGGRDWLAAEREFYFRAWRHALSITNTEPSRRSALEEDDRYIYSRLIRPLARKISAAVQALSIPSHSIAGASLARCVARLNLGIPISAQGLPRERLREMLSRHRRRRFGNEADRRKAFLALARSFDESPLTMPTILQASHERRQNILSRALKHRLRPSPRQWADQLSNDLRELDALIANSIGVSDLHTTLNVHLSGGAASDGN